MITGAGCNLSDSLTRMAMDNPAEGGQGTAVEKGLAGLQKSSTDNSSEDILKTLMEKYDHLIDTQPDSTIEQMIQRLQGKDVSCDPENSRKVVKQHRRQEITMLKSNVERARRFLKALQKQMSECYPYAHQLYTKKVQIFQAITNFHDKKVGKRIKTRKINQLQGECEELIDAFHTSALLQAARRNRARVAHGDLRGISDQEMKEVQKQALKKSIAVAEESRDSAQQLKEEAEATINYKALMEMHMQVIQAIINQPSLF